MLHERRHVCSSGMSESIVPAISRATNQTTLLNIHQRSTIPITPRIVCQEVRQ